MDKQAARRLVQDTLQSAFSKEKFARLTKELLNHVEDAPLAYRGNLIPDAYDGYIQSLERIGKYTDPDGKRTDILIITLKRNTSLERARTMQRNFIAWFLASRGETKDAALVAFVSPDSEDWRFSLVRMELSIGETATGRVTAKAQYTPARRSSFLVGVHESSHTAQSRLVPLLTQDDRDPMLSQVEDAFSIERASNEFFEKYRELFYKLVEALESLKRSDPAIEREFEEKQVDIADYAKKLLGQIVFLYFLQKKGWFGVPRKQAWGSGSKGFVRELFDRKHSDYKNFFNDILEPLFYEALRQERQEDYYSRFDCRIPFLNGGLFDPLNDYDWINTDLNLPDELFSNKDTDKKSGDVGSGILDIFDRYNFTVNEDEPLEKEVAVDPEMLGKVFENLLEVKNRKSKGTYYTPREIVHYMCQESLINYLATELEGKVGKEDIELLVRIGERYAEHETHTASLEKETERYSHVLPESIRDHAADIDTKLATIRVCDPAVGSGAFPVGMMSEIIRTRTTLSAYIGNGKGRTAYDFKRHAIQECLYGVDIDPGAIEIAKLRLWLSLVVDEQERETIQPLPNLDYKLVCGNSLLGVERNLLNNHLFDEIEKLKPLYFEETRTTKKHALKKQIDELILQLTNGHKEFDFEIYFSEVWHAKGGFDVVMENPPYVRVDDLPQSDKKLYKARYKSTTGKYDLYYLFFERSLTLANKNGTCVFITPNKWCAAESASVLRGLLIAQMPVGEIISVSRIRVFAEASNYPVVTILTKSTVARQNYTVRQITTLGDLPRRSGGQSYTSQGSGFKSFPAQVIPININQKVFDFLCETYSECTRLSSIICVSEGLRIPAKLESEVKTDHPIVKQYQFERYSEVKPGTYVTKEALRSLLKETAGRSRRAMADKLLIAEDALRISATLDLNHHVPQGGVYFASVTDTSTNLKFVLGLLNSKLLSFLYESLYAGMHMGGGYLRYRTKFIENLPFPIQRDGEGERQIASAAESILSSSLSDAERQKTETDIDKAVYQIYGLTPDEIAVVEGRT